MRSWIATGALLFSLACGSTDAGRPAAMDASRADAAGADASTPDASTPDATTTPDAARPDAGRDSGVPPGCDFGGRAPVSESPLPHASGRTERSTASGFTDEYIYDATESAKLGIRHEWGGSVIFFGQHDGRVGTNGTNTIDANDTGREVQVALYDPDRAVQGCSWNASCMSSMPCPLSIRYLGWNPVQGGNRCNIGSPVERVTSGSGALRAVTIPLQWNPDWDATDCAADSCGSSGPSSRPPSDVRLTQSVRFISPRIAEVHYVVENLGDVARSATLQEMPTMYTANGRGGPDLWRLLDPSGTEIPIDTPSGGDGFFYENFESSGPWVTLQNDDLSYGVAILYENGLRSFQGWQKRSLPFNNVRSRIRFGLPARGVVQARAYLLIGSYDTIRADAENLLATLPPFGVLDAPTEVAPPGEIPIRGWALDNHGVASVEARIDESVTVPLTHGGGRPDVCLVWPGYPGCDAVGYAGSYDFGAPQRCPHLVEIIATDTDGNRRTIAERLVTITG